MQLATYARDGNVNLFNKVNNLPDYKWGLFGLRSIKFKRQIVLKSNIARRKVGQGVNLWQSNLL